ncbi:MAG: transcriptional repressor [Clostridia bacterium]|nr:transcriptional repressor [Clostridia bacterium]
MLQEKKVPRGEYMTHGYRLVRDALAQIGDRHPSADDLYEYLLAKGEKIGRTTVYRQLERLVSEGIAAKINREGAVSCYTYALGSCSSHYHLLCTRCGNLTHLSCHNIEELCAHIKEEHGVSIDMARTVLYGLCAACSCAQRKDAT